MLSVEKLSSPFFPETSFQAEQGECICIHGQSGSGKTLLLRAIADLDQNSGTIMLDNHLRETMPAEQWRRQVTYLPAESHWWSVEVSDHFISENTDFTVLDLSPQIGHWQVTHLSSGEKQRLALLRALDHSPRVLLLDEVTANLDKKNTQRVEHLLQSRMQQGLTLVWVSHDSQQRARMASKSYCINNGKFQLDNNHGPD